MHWKLLCRFGVVPIFTIATAACDKAYSIQNGVMLTGASSRASVVGYTATDTNYRLVIAKAFNDGTSTMVCAEAPADTATAVSTALAAAVTAKVTGPQLPVSGEGNAQIARAYSEALAPLVARSQGLAMYRDGMYALCQAYMNRALSEPSYANATQALQATAAKLIETEIRHGLPGRPSSINGPATSPPSQK